jgi:hypothetical protein
VNADVAALFERRPPNAGDEGEFTGETRGLGRERRRELGEVERPDLRQSLGWAVIDQYVKRGPITRRSISASTIFSTLFAPRKGCTSSPMSRRRSA